MNSVKSAMSVFAVWSNVTGAKAEVARFGEITEPRHRLALEKFVEGEKAAIGEIAEFSSPTRGVILLYLANESSPTWKADPMLSGSPEYGLVVAYSVYVPSQAISAFPKLIQFRVRDADNKSLPIVDVTKP